MRRTRRHVRMPPDLTSLLDVLFILIFAALIRAAAADQAAEASSKPSPMQPPMVSLDSQFLRTKALEQLTADLASRPTVMFLISAKGTITSFEAQGRVTPLDVPLLEHSPDPDVELSYLGDRSAELRICRVAALHVGAADLRKYLVIIAPEKLLEDLPHALFDGLHRDVDRCMSDQGGIAVIVDPTMTDAHNHRGLVKP